MNVIAVILHIVFLVIPFLFIGFGALIGRKLKWQFSLSKIIVIIVSAILAALLASFLTFSVLVEFGVFDAIVDAIDFGAFTDFLHENEVTKEFICAVVAMIVAPIIYLPIFLLLRGILGLINRLAIARIYLKKDPNQKKRVRTKGKNPLGILMGAVCGMFLFSAIMLSGVTTLSVLGNVASSVVGIVDAEDEEAAAVLDIVEDVSSAAKTNASSVVVTVTGGKLVYNMMTTYEVMGANVSLENELGFVAEVANTAVTVIDENVDNAEKAKAVRSFTDVLEEESFVMIIMADVISSATDAWENDEEFCGIASPVEEEGDLLDIFVDCLATTTRETIKEDLTDATEIVAIVIENDCLNAITENAEDVIKNEEVTSKILLVCIENERWYSAIDRIADYGIDMVLSSFGVFETKEDAYVAFLEEVENLRGTLNGREEKKVLSDIVKSYGLTVDAELFENVPFDRMTGNEILQWVETNIVSSVSDFSAKTCLVTSDEVIAGSATLSNTENEAKALAHTLACAIVVVDDIQGADNVSSALLEHVGPTLDAMNGTETFGADKPGLFLISIMQSKEVCSEIGFTTLQATNTAQSIVTGAKSKGYSYMLVSLGHMVEVIENASNSNDITENVDKLLSDLTPEAALVIQSAATPETVMNYGVPEQSAEPVSGLVSNMFTDLANAKDQGMSDEEYARESQAVSHVVNVMMSAGEMTNNGGEVSETFGEEGALGVTVESYVDDVLTSTVVSDALVNTVYGENEEPTLDPLMSGRELSESESQELETVLNDKWNNASEAEKQDGTFAKKITSIGAIVNLNVTITSDGVQLS